MKLFSHSLSLSLRDSQVTDSQAPVLLLLPQGPCCELGSCLSQAPGVPRAAHEASPLLHLALDTQPHWGLCPLLLGLDKLQEIVFTVY